MWPASVRIRLPTEEEGVHVIARHVLEDPGEHEDVAVGQDEGVLHRRMHEVHAPRQVGGPRRHVLRALGGGDDARGDGEQPLRLKGQRAALAAVASHLLEHPLLLLDGVAAAGAAGDVGDE